MKVVTIQPLLSQVFQTAILSQNAIQTLSQNAFNGLVSRCIALAKLTIFFYIKANELVYHQDIKAGRIA